VVVRLHRHGVTEVAAGGAARAGAIVPLRPVPDAVAGPARTPRSAYNWRPHRTGAPMRHWLMKSEPDEFSIDDLQRVGTEPWSGVRNYQARNFLREMKRGDGVLFYHSSCAEPGVVGIGRIVHEAAPDPSQFDRNSDYFDPASKREEPRWDLVDVGFERKLARTITLDAIKSKADALGDFALIRRGNRLSVLPVTAAQWKLILSLEKASR
jgi:predicted RNA-binding protein with PUA-like domain